MAIFEEGGFCLLEEYIRGERNRLRADDLQVDELYMLMMALRTVTPDRQAAKLPALIHGIVTEQTALTKVHFTLYSKSLKTTGVINGAFESGYWLNPEHVRIGDVAVRSGYFMDYNDPLENALQRLLAMESPIRKPPDKVAGG